MNADTELKTVHLLDDRRLGGVMRFLDCLMELRPNDEVIPVKRKSLRAKSYPAGTIVSHLAISWRSLPMLIALRACNPSARLIHVEHSYCSGFQQHRVPKIARFHTLLRTVYALFDQVVAVSKGQAEWMRAIGVVAEAKLQIVPPLVDVAPFLAVPDPVPATRLRYGFVGRLDEQKGLDTALEAWALLAPKGATLEIFGDGPKREALEAQVRDLPSVRFHGRVDDPATAYESIDVAILPSRWEPYGLSCLEARAAGRPVIVSDVDGLPEQVPNGGGFVVDRGMANWLKVFSSQPSALDIAEDPATLRQSAKDDAARAERGWAKLLDVKASSDVKVGNAQEVAG